MTQTPLAISAALFKARHIGQRGLCVDRLSGKVVWKSGSEKAGYATPILVTISTDGTVTATGSVGAKVTYSPGVIVFTAAVGTESAVVTCTPASSPMVLGTEIVAQSVSSSGSLPSTGSDSRRPLALAATFLLAGLGIVITARRAPRH